MINRQLRTEAEKQQFFCEALLPHADALLTFAFHVTKNEKDAEDFVQETFLKSYKNIERFTQDNNSKAWLFRILKNIIILNHRKNRRKPKWVNLEEVIQMHDDENEIAISGYVDLPKEMFRHMLDDEVINTIGRLPENFQIILLLVIEGFNASEISRILDIPVGVVRARAFRAKNRLKVLLKDYAKEKGY